jgi:hypothetical protein
VWYVMPVVLPVPTEQLARVVLSISIRLSTAPLALVFVSVCMGTIRTRRLEWHWGTILYATPASSHARPAL